MHEGKILSKNVNIIWKSKVKEKSVVGVITKKIVCTHRARRIVNKKNGGCVYRMCVRMKVATGVFSQMA